MDELTTAILRDRQVLVDALKAIQLGHDESVSFLRVHMTDGASNLHPPKSLTESILLAETVARIALDRQHLDTYHGPLLRKMLLGYGGHQGGCGGKGDCRCGWEGILSRLTETTDIPVGEDIPPNPLDRGDIIERNE